MNEKNSTGKTPVDNAHKAGHKEVVDLLRTHGAIYKTDKQKDYMKPLSIKINNEGEKNPIKMTVLYDNFIVKEGTKSAHGFSCLIEGIEKTILFDTGGDSEVFQHNINMLNVDVNTIEQVIISHNHWDHIGGLFSLLEDHNKVPVYLPYSFPYDFVRKVDRTGAEVVPVNEPVEICNNVYLTGEMGTYMKEQSLIVNTPKGLIIVTGCSHQGIVNILKKAKSLFDRDIYLVFGGFHLGGTPEQELTDIINNFKDLQVSKCGATHCTGQRAMDMFKEAFGENYVPIGVGKVLEFNKKN